MAAWRSAHRASRRWSASSRRPCTSSAQSRSASSISTGCSGTGPTLSARHTQRTSRPCASSAAHSTSTAAMPPGATRRATRCRASSSRSTTTRAARWSRKSGSAAPGARKTGLRSGPTRKGQRRTCQRSMSAASGPGRRDGQRRARGRRPRLQITAALPQRASARHAAPRARLEALSHLRPPQTASGRRLQPLPQAGRGRYTRAGSRRPAGHPVGALQGGLRVRA